MGTGALKVHQKYARMVKLVDTRDLKSLAYGVPVRVRFRVPY